MSTLHPTTAALLAHIRSLPCVAEPRIDWSYVNAWEAAGCPDAPEPRFVPTSPGWYWRKGGGTGTYIACVTFDPNGLQNCLAWTSGFLRIDVTDDGLWLGPVAPWSEPLKPGEFLDGVVEHLAPSPAKADVAAARAWFGEAPKSEETVDPITSFDAAVWARAFHERFPTVPTNDAWAWFSNALMRGFDEAKAHAELEPSPHPDPGPCPPKPRTAEEARANPMPGDRWTYQQEPELQHYTLVRRRDGLDADLNGEWIIQWASGTHDDADPAYIPEPGETYLGNFPLETP